MINKRRVRRRIKSTRVQELSNQGLSPKQIAEVLKVSLTTVYRHYQRTPIPDFWIERIRASYKRSHGSSQIYFYADKHVLETMIDECNLANKIYGKKKTHIKFNTYHLIKLLPPNHTPRPKRASKLSKEAAFALYSRGYSVREVARRLNKPYATVWRAINARATRS